MFVIMPLINITVLSIYHMPVVRHKYFIFNSHIKEVNIIITLLHVRKLNCSRFI